MKFMHGLVSTYGKDFYKKPFLTKMPYLTDKMLSTKFLG